MRLTEAHSYSYGYRRFRRQNRVMKRTDENWPQWIEMATHRDEKQNALCRINEYDLYGWQSIVSTHRSEFMN